MEVELIPAQGMPARTQASHESAHKLVYFTHAQDACVRVVCTPRAKAACDRLPAAGTHARWPMAREGGHALEQPRVRARSLASGRMIEDGRGCGRAGAGEASEPAHYLRYEGTTSR